MLRWFLFVFCGGFGFFAGLCIFAFGLRFLFRGVGIGTAFLALFAVFVAFASVIGLIKSGAFKDYAGAGAEETFHFTPATKGAFADGVGCYRLEPLKLVSTIFTYIIIGRHNFG